MGGPNAIVVVVVAVVRWCRVPVATTIPCLSSSVGRCAPCASDKGGATIDASLHCLSEVPCL